MSHTHIISISPAAAATTATATATTPTPSTSPTSRTRTPSRTHTHTQKQSRPREFGQHGQHGHHAIESSPASLLSSRSGTQAVQSRTQAYQDQHQSQELVRERGDKREHEHEHSTRPEGYKNQPQPLSTFSSPPPTPSSPSHGSQSSGQAPTVPTIPSTPLAPSSITSTTLPTSSSVTSPSSPITPFAPSAPSLPPVETRAKPTPAVSTANPPRRIHPPRESHIHTRDDSDPSDNRVPTLPPTGSPPLLTSAPLDTDRPPLSPAEDPEEMAEAYARTSSVMVDYPPGYVERWDVWFDDMHLHSSYSNQIPFHEGNWYFPDPGRIDNTLPWFIPTKRVGSVQMYDLMHPDGRIVKNALTHETDNSIWQYDYVCYNLNFVTVQMTPLNGQQAELMIVG